MSTGERCRPRVWGPVRNSLGYGGYTETLYTMARIYDMARWMIRSQAAKRGWATRRANIARRIG